MSRTWNLIKLIILIIITLFVIWLFSYLMKGNSINFGFKINESTEEVYSDIYDTIFDEITIDSVASNIYVKNSNDNRIRLSVTGNQSDVNVEEYGNKLNIETSTPRCRVFCFNKKISSVTLYVPSDYDNVININNDFGDIKIGDLSFANIEVREDAGDVDIKGVNNVKVDNKLGDIRIHKVNSSLILINNMGDIKIDNVNLLIDSYIENNMGDIKVGKTNDINIDAETGLGDVDINRIHRESKTKLTIKNDLGDIKVNN